MFKNSDKLKLITLFILTVFIFISCVKQDVAIKDNLTSTIDKKTDEETSLDSSLDSSQGELKDSDAINDNIIHGIKFVQQEHFYKDTVLLEIESHKPCDIYYTLDGTEPDKSKNLYEEPIKLTSGAIAEVYSIKARGFYEDGSQTDTITHTYFVGEEVDKRFDTLIFSVTTDSYNLYDYEHGIFVAGKLRDDYIREHPNEEIIPPDPANFNIRGRESEREVYLEIFEPDGSRIVNQKVGIRVYGGWSRANLQKSIKIYARKAYDEDNNKLRYEFFPNEKINMENGTIIDSYKRLVLRNSGNDNGFGFIRDELLQTLAGQAGYKDYHSVRPAALFINGDYHGCYWLHEAYCDEYFEEHYGEYSGRFEILEGGETFKNVNEEDSNKDAIKDYEEAYSYTYDDLTKDLVYNKLRELIDVENYLAYYALQIYIGNEDWPHNNYKVYRYYPAEGEEYGEAPFDGKWRYLLHDLDYSFAIYGTSPWVDNLRRFVSKTGDIREESPLFSQLIRREDCKEFFVNKTLDLINGAFSEDNLGEELDKMHSARINEQMHMYGKNLIADWVHPDQLPWKMEEIKSYNSQRIKYTLGKYKGTFELDSPFKLNVYPAYGGGVRINGIEIYKEFEGKYYPDYDVIIHPIIPAGRELNYWLVNEEIYYDSVLTINSSMIVDGQVEVVCLFKEKAENPKLFIRELCSYSNQDYIILINPYEDDIMMRGYSITDDANKPGKFILPSRILRSGESLKIIGESNREIPSKGMIRAGFNLKDGETVTLYLDGEIVDEVTIPDLEKGSIYRRDMGTLRFFEKR